MKRSKQETCNSGNLALQIESTVYEKSCKLQFHLDCFEVDILTLKAPLKGVRLYLYEVSPLMISPLRNFSWSPQAPGINAASLYVLAA